jgi:hypothetical protein
MKALCNPHPVRIMLGEKPLENRPRSTGHRGPFAIHAGLSRDWLRPGDEERYGDELVYGAIVGVADLVACLALANPTWPRRWADLRAHPDASGPWCYVVANPRRLPAPIPIGGALGFWTVPPAIARQVTEQLASAEVR